MFEYTMVQVPANFAVRGVAHGNEAAQFLQNVVNQYSVQGWEFYRVDRLGIVSQPGCVASLLGARQSLVEYSVVTFRRPHSD